MRDPDAHPTRPPVDLLTAVREWLWGHSSQPNGDPWDGDPEHLDRAAQRLLNDLTHQLLATDPSTSAADQDTERARDRRDVTASASVLSVGHGHPGQAGGTSKTRSNTSTPPSTA